MNPEPQTTMSPQVSVIIPTRDRVGLLTQTLDSVRAQTDPRWQAIVVDDGSTDGTLPYLDQLSREEPRIHVIRRSADRRRGANTCRNIGIEQSATPYAMFLDSDDLLHERCIEARIKLMDSKPSLDFAVFASQCFRVVPGDLQLLWNTHTNEPDLDRFLRLDGPWQTTGPIWRRAALARIGPWDEELLSWQDLDFHMRALIAGLTYEKFPTPDNFYRMPENKRGSLTTRQGQSDHSRSHQRFVQRVLTLLQHSNLLDHQRRTLVGGFCFFFAERWTWALNKGEGIKMWQAWRRMGLIDPRMYVEGLAYLRVSDTFRVRQLLWRYLEKAWPTDLLRRSSTILNTPLPPGLSPLETSRAAAANVN